MATGKIYVVMNRFVCEQIFDAKFKGEALKAMEKAVARAVKASAKLTLDAPAERGAKGWLVTGKLESLKPDGPAKKLECHCSYVISTWPGKAHKHTYGGQKTRTLRAPGKVDASDVSLVVSEAVNALVGEAVKFMEITVP